MSGRARPPLLDRVPAGPWRQTLTAGWTLFRGAQWIQCYERAHARRWSARWWLALYLFGAGWVFGWGVSPLLVAARRALPGGTWVGDRRALLLLTYRRRDGRWMISDFVAWPVRSGCGRPLLDRVCAAADAAGAGLRLVAHNDALAEKVYRPAGFVLVERTGLLRMPVMHRDPKPVPVPDDQTAPRGGLVTP